MNGVTSGPRIGAFGSPEGGEAVEAFDSNVREFHRTLKLRAECMKQPEPQSGGQTAYELALDYDRGQATEAYVRVRTLIRAMNWRTSREAALPTLKSVGYLGLGPRDNLATAFGPSRHRSQDCMAFVFKLDKDDGT